MEGFLESVGGGAKTGVLEREFEEFISFEAIGMGSEEATEYVFYKWR